ncbi:hypothetical protein GQ44DRAFT_759724 [Phaeosphaeriaceae sp. PMI808]|nr:hypothetical protein GQ44DRAFT_759724 [Phaeosphaeriaceae sp. PMI808]
MKSFITIVLASLAITRVACQLSAKDTVVEADYAKFDAVMASATDETYFGYFYSNDTVWIKVHNADTHDIIAEDTFQGNGKAVEYLKQTGDIKDADLSADGPMGEMQGKAACPRPLTSAPRSFLSHARPGAINSAPVAILALLTADAEGAVMSVGCVDGSYGAFLDGDDDQGANTIVSDIMSPLIK